MPPAKRIDPMDRHVGQQIKIARLAAGISQETLGNALGLTFQQVQKYEKGTNRVSGSRLAQIAKALKVNSVEMFFRGGPGYVSDGSRKTDSVVYQMLSSSDGQEIAKIWHSLSPKQRRAFVTLAASIIEAS
jgi:transcriptional regulator with XRE-family HTH domain